MITSLRRLSPAHLIAVTLAFVAALPLTAAMPSHDISSPDGLLRATVELTAEGRLTYQVHRDNEPVLLPSRLGLIRDDADFSQGLRLLSVTEVEPITDDYELLNAKRRHHHYRAHRRVLHLENADGHPLDLIFQVSDDGVAFRYAFPETDSTPRRLTAELSSFHLPADTLGWLQPMSIAKTGWMSTNPSYEEFYQQGIPVGTPSTLGVGWVYPALFKTPATWVVLSEGTLSRADAGTRLAHESPNGEYTIAYPDPRETMDDLPVTPVSTLPYATPWRIIAVGDLRTIAESTLGTDLATPATTDPTAPVIQPGKSSWSWPQLGDDQTVFDVQRDFIDFAASMNWAYCLIDSMWDQQIGYERLRELAEHAASKNVGLLVWYNSNGNWNDAPQTPRGKLVDRESRRAEFARLKDIGIRGLKVDFFAGDGQPMIAYYHDLLEDAAEFGLLMNFHGATLPRGWQRTYPNLMTMESIKGFEFITFDQRNADEEPVHATTIPFTRNLFDPMDFTPVCLEKLGATKLVSTGSFQLALAVIFTSGIQHYPDVPAGMAKQPAFVQEFMRRVPSIWEDTKFVDGYPGKFAVFARQGDGKWFVAGINGETTERSLSLDLTRLGKLPATGTMITDGPDSTFVERTVTVDSDGQLDVTLAPHGGFVLVF